MLDKVFIESMIVRNNSINGSSFGNISFVNKETGTVGVLMVFTSKGKAKKLAKMFGARVIHLGEGLSRLDDL